MVVAGVCVEVERKKGAGVFLRMFNRVRRSGGGGPFYISIKLAKELGPTNRT